MVEEKAMNTAELSDMFGISKNQVIILCKIKGSPAFRAGNSKKAPWLCFPSEFKKWRLHQAEAWKG